MTRTIFVAAFLASLLAGCEWRVGNQPYENEKFVESNVQTESTQVVSALEPESRSFVIGLFAPERPATWLQAAEMKMIALPLPVRHFAGVAEALLPSKERMRGLELLALTNGNSIVEAIAPSNPPQREGFDVLGLPASMELMSMRKVWSYEAVAACYDSGYEIHSVSATLIGADRASASGLGAAKCNVESFVLVQSDRTEFVIQNMRPGDEEDLTNPASLKDQPDQLDMVESVGVVDEDAAPPPVPAAIGGNGK